jgi:hypothetical protein
MTIPTALAPTVDLATPKVEAHAEKLRKFLNGEISRFYKCDPDDMRVEDRQGNKWIEGSWGLHLLVPHFSLDIFPEVNELSSVINIGDISFKPVSNSRIELVFWLTARVMR